MGWISSQQSTVLVFTEIQLPYDNCTHGIYSGKQLYMAQKQIKESFQSLLESFDGSHDLRTVFDDFLTLTLASFSRNPETGLSYHEDVYLETIGKYDPVTEVDRFPKLLSRLVLEMEARLDSTSGFDVLGEFYEEKLATNRKSQFFTPWPICKMMAELTLPEEEQVFGTKRVLDPSCGSGRMLMVSTRVLGSMHNYFGIDIDAVCAKMAALNLFLSGVGQGEVMQANALDLHDFKISYQISHFPMGIYWITDKEKSGLWKAQQNLLKQSNAGPPPFDPGMEMNGFKTQLTLL